MFLVEFVRLTESYQLISQEAFSSDRLDNTCMFHQFGMYENLQSDMHPRIVSGIGIIET